MKILGQDEGAYTYKRLTLEILIRFFPDKSVICSNT